MSTPGPLRIRSPSITQNPLIAQMPCGRPRTVNSKKPRSKARPTVSVVEEQERSVELVPIEICTSSQGIFRIAS